VNTGHSAIAYLGYARGKATIHAALEDDRVREGASKALEETGLVLAREYGFHEEELREYRQKVLARFENPRISDEVTRVARAPIRKLGHDERFVSPALRLLEMGHAPTHLAEVIGAVLAFDHPQDAEAVVLQQEIQAEGERAALAGYAGIAEDHPLVELVLERSNDAGGRGG
jgi:mannitol-1-phosphate 5-dehydrogenase